MRTARLLYRRLATLEPGNPARLLAAIDADVRMAVMMIDRGKDPEAGTILEGAEREIATLPDQNSQQFRKVRAQLRATLGSYHQRRKKIFHSFVAWAGALADYKILATENADTPLYRYLHASALRSLGIVTILAGDVVGGLKRLEEAEKLLAALVKEYPDDVSYRDLHKRLSDLLKGIKPPPKPPDQKS